MSRTELVAAGAIRPVELRAPRRPSQVLGRRVLALDAAGRSAWSVAFGAGPASAAAYTSPRKWSVDPNAPAVSIAALERQCYSLISEATDWLALEAYT